MTTPRVSVCIATYRRPERLNALLADLLAQTIRPDEIVVVDNDANASAREVVLQFAAAQSGVMTVHYDVQPKKNISLTRNRTVQLATGDWLGFLDDDERAPSDWLAAMMQCAATHSAEAVLGPVVAEVPADAPTWLKRGGFYDLPRFRHGEVVPANFYKVGNAFISAVRLQALTGPFDEAYGLTGGEDGDMLSRLAASGVRIVWCDHGAVSEPVEARRLSFSWLWLRALRGGQDFARHTMSGRYGRVTIGGTAIFTARALVQLLVSLLLVLVSWPAGRHRAGRWLFKAAANLGKLSYFFGWHYKEYA